MHRQFLDLLPQVTGQAKPSIAVNLDVRGFSQFAMTVDSVDAAVYIRKVYERVLTEYFPSADFFKPTGDGLLLVFELDERDEKDLAAKANLVVSTALRLLDDFPSLLDGDPWIYFPVPQALGIGIARGAASRLASKDKTLDYSGNALNVASRLMDLARPSGVVVGSSFPFQLLESDLQERFTTDSKVYVRSIAEKLATTIHYTHDRTMIASANRKPLDGLTWNEQPLDITLKDLRQSSSFFVYLETEPIDPSQVRVVLTHPALTPSGGRAKSLITEVDPEPGEVQYEDNAGRPRLLLDYAAWAERLQTKGVKRSWPIKIAIRYPS